MGAGVGLRTHYDILSDARRIAPIETMTVQAATELSAMPLN